MSGDRYIEANRGKLFNSLVVKSVYIQTISKPIGTVDTPRTPRALEVVGSIPGVSVTSFLLFFAFALGSRAYRSPRRLL